MNTTLSIAFLAGLISFLSPCVLPLIPGYISYISGTSLEKLIEKRNNLVVIKTIFFTLGFSLVFISLGSTASFLGKFFLSCRWLHEHSCVDGHKSVSEYSQMLGIEANSLLKLKALISFWTVAKMYVCRSWNQLQLLKMESKSQHLHAVEDGVKISTSARWPNTTDEMTRFYDKSYLDVS